jgi:hypothetical protein
VPKRCEKIRRHSVGKTLIKINRPGIEYCAGLGENRGKYNHPDWQQDGYRQGLLNSDENPYVAERLGAYGEFAFSKFVGGIPLNETVSRYGDRGTDFRNFGTTIDAKFQWEPSHKAIQLNYFGPYYVTATDRFGKEKQLKSNIYFFLTMHQVMKAENGKYKEVSRQDVKKLGKDLEADFIIMELRGYIYRDTILANKEERIAPLLWDEAGTSNRRNYYIKSSELLSPQHFLEHVGHRSKVKV